MSADENKALIRRFYDEVWHSGDLAAFGQFADEGALQNSAMPEQGTYKETIARSRAEYPDLHWDIGQMVAEGDAVAWHWTFHGTNAATGKRETSQGVTMCRVVGGKITDRLAYGGPRTEET